MNMGPSCVYDKYGNWMRWDKHLGLIRIVGILPQLDILFRLELLCLLHWLPQDKKDTAIFTYHNNPKALLDCMPLDI